MPRLHHRHWQLCYPCWWYEQNWWQVKTVSDRKFWNCFVLSRPSFQFATRTCLQSFHTTDRTEQNWGLLETVLTCRQCSSHLQQDKTRQSCLVQSVVWTSHKCDLCCWFQLLLQMSVSLCVWCRITFTLRPPNARPIDIIIKRHYVPWEHDTSL